MATKDLKDKYGEGNTRSIINRAIRAEILGGGKLLDLRTWLHPRPESREKGHVVQVLDQILFDFENEIRRRYGMNELDADDAPPPPTPGNPSSWNRRPETGT